MKTNYTISTEELESIERYLLGETSAEERLAFENKLQEDGAWAAKVDEVKLLMLGIEKAELKERLHEYHNDIKKNGANAAGGKTIGLNRKWLVAASVVMLASLSVWFFTIRPDKYEKLYATYFQPDPGLMSAMGVGENYAFNKAMLDYKTGNYKKAIAEWDKLRTDMPGNDTLEYFLGVAQQANGNNTAAIGLLQKAANDSNNPFYKDACWYIGLALLKKGNIQESIIWLEKSGHPKRNELINNLK